MCNYQWGIEEKPEKKRKESRQGFKREDAITGGRACRKLVA